MRIGDLDIDRLSAFQDSTGKLYTYSYTPTNPLPIALHSYGQPVVTYQWDESGTLPRLLSCTTSSVFFQKSAATWQFDYLPEHTGSMPDSVILTGSVVAKLGYWDLNSLKCTLGYDHLGTVKLIADPFNALVKELFYDSFGNCMSETEQEIYFPLSFAGGLRDIATGFVCFGFRDYDPTVGRFTTPDPALDVRGDGDIYDYCVDDPVNLVDENGLAFSSAEAADAARKGHEGISHPFGAKHGSASANNNANSKKHRIVQSKSTSNQHSTGEKLRTQRQVSLEEEYSVKTYVRGQRPLIFGEKSFIIGSLRNIKVKTKPFYIRTLMPDNEFKDTPQNKGVFHEAFVSPQDGSNFGFGPLNEGTNFHSDDKKQLKLYRLDTVEYRADIIDEAMKIVERKHQKITKQREEMNKSLSGKDRINIDTYYMLGDNCQYATDEVLKVAEEIAKKKGLTLVVRRKK